MEIELKYGIDTDAAEQILRDPYVCSLACGEIKTHYMHSVYYDTADHALKNAGGALRMRYEGETPENSHTENEYVCCFKRKKFDLQGLSRRDEYEANATDIVLGIRALLSKGAPAEILEPCLTATLIDTAEVSFVRKCFPLKIENTVIELALDLGAFPCPDGTSIPLRELELELKEGSEKELVSLGAYLEKTYQLRPESASKYARARAARIGKK